MAGRQAGRLIYIDYTTDRVANQRLDRKRLEALKYPGDDKLEQFMNDWYAILENQQTDVDPIDLEQIMYAKIKDSVRLRVYIDYYNRIEEDHENRCYQYLEAS